MNLCSRIMATALMITGMAVSQIAWSEETSRQSLFPAMPVWNIPASLPALEVGHALSPGDQLAILADAQSLPDGRSWEALRFGGERLLVRKFADTEGFEAEFLVSGSSLFFPDPNIELLVWRDNAGIAVLVNGVLAAGAVGGEVSIHGLESDEVMVDRFYKNQSQQYNAVFSSSHVIRSSLHPDEADVLVRGQQEFDDIDITLAPNKETVAEFYGASQSANTNLLSTNALGLAVYTP